MKLAFDRARQEGAQRRPFRKLAIAGKLLTTTIFAGLLAVCTVSCHSREEKAEAELQARLAANDSLRLANGWSTRGAAYERLPGLEYRVEDTIGCITDREKEVMISLNRFRDNLNRCIAHRAKRLKEATSAGRHLLISDAVDEYAWVNRPWQDSSSIDSATRRADSLFLLRTLVEVDSAGLVEALASKIEEHRNRGTLQGNAARPYGPLISSVISAARPMLPEARERRYDSLLLHSAALDYAEKKNEWILEGVVAQGVYGIDWTRSVESIKKLRPRVCRITLKAYESRKLPDRKRFYDSLMGTNYDSLIVTKRFNDCFWKKWVSEGMERKRFPVDPEVERKRRVEREWKEHLAEEHYKEWGLTGNSPLGGYHAQEAASARTEPHRAR